MLIDAKTIVEDGDIVTLKLLSGEEIVGKMTEQTKDALTIAKPMAVIPGPQGWAFTSVMGSTDADVTVRILRTALAMYPVKTGNKVTISYLEMTTGLTIPKGHDTKGLV